MNDLIQSRFAMFCQVPIGGAIALLAIAPSAYGATQSSEKSVHSREFDSTLNIVNQTDRVGQSETTSEIPEIAVDTPILSAQTLPQVPGDAQDRPPSLEPQPEFIPTPVLPPPDQLLQPVTPTPNTGNPLEGDVPETIVVQRFDVVGSTIFTPEELAAVTAPYTNRPISLNDLFEARSAVTQLYVDNGYITSGAYIPPQVLEDGVVTIEVVEGTLEEINISGTEDLNPNYVRSRIALSADTPLNVNELLDGLRLLQLDPLIQSLSTELAAGPRPGTSILDVQVTEADTFDVTLELDNGRSPSVGSFRQRLELSELNVSGNGDALSLAYTHTDGSNAVDASYQIFLNPHNGTLGLSTGFTNSQVIEPPFDFLNINSESNYVELTYRQPLMLTPTQEFAIGVTASRQETRSEFLGNVFEEAVPFPSSGSDENGEIAVTALRFFQEWTNQGDRQVFAVRSQFSLGLDALDSTVNEDGRPDSRFLSWRGQAQWVRLLARDTLLLVRTDLQFSNDSMLPLEQFGVGGARSVRGYRQDLLLTDNGMLISAELRIPVLRSPSVDGLLQVAPFIDIGTGWNVESIDPDPNTLVGLGVGLLWRQEDFSARLDWGIPLTNADLRNRTWQESGVYFSIVFNPF
jgi:hemolysin activation/secretion protein